jgi:hypothetical protein
MLIARLGLRRTADADAVVRRLFGSLEEFWSRPIDLFDPSGERERFERWPNVHSASTICWRARWTPHGSPITSGRGPRIENTSR